MLYGILLGIEVIVAILLVTFILLHRGKGADVGAVFSGGGGGSSSVFGARGSASFLTKLVATLSALFLANSLILTYVANRDFGDSVIDDGGALEMPAADDAEGAADVPLEEDFSEGDVPLDDLPLDTFPGDEDLPSAPTEEAAPPASPDPPASPESR